MAKAFHEHVIIGGVCRSPTKLLSDRGTEFLNELFEELLKQFQLSHFKTSPYHPTGNAQCMEVDDKTTVTIVEVVPVSGS